LFLLIVYRTDLSHHRTSRASEPSHTNLKEGFFLLHIGDVAIDAKHFFSYMSPK